MSATLIVPAAGRGQRMGQEMNKQYLQLLHKPVLAHTLAACFVGNCFQTVIVVVTPGEEEILHRDVLLPWLPGRNIMVIAGGKERQDSVYNAIKAVPDDTDIVCIHDGARPLVQPALIQRCLDTAMTHGAAIAAVPVKDTIKVVNGEGLVTDTPPRQTLWSVQTPQAFRRDWLEDAYKCAEQDYYYATDDAALLERYGYTVRVVLGHYENIKVTTPEDLVLAAALLGRRTDANWDRL